MKSTQHNGLSPRFFRFVLTFGIIALLGIAVAESLHRGIITNDAFGYWILLGFCCFAYMLSFSAAYIEVAKFIAFASAAIYLMIFVIIGFFYAATSGVFYTVAATMLWLPLVLVSAFLYLPMRNANMGVAIIFVVEIALTLMSFFIKSEYSMVPLQSLMVNLVLAHLLLVICVLGIIRIRQDKSKSMAYANKMEVAANQDSLLGIGNRRYLDDAMTQMAKSDTNCSLLVLDIDHFKQVNDELGHASGDLVLAEIVANIRTNLRPGDLLGRWGGEEFMIIAHNTDLNQAKEFAERIRRAIEEHHFIEGYRLTLSIGVTQYKPGEPSDQVFKRADNALYDAKQNGRNRTVTHAL